MGLGPLLATDAAKKLIDADTTPDKKWLDWIFYQAAGGDKAKQMAESAMQQIKDRFIDERVNGFQHGKTKQFIPAVSAQEAEARWEKNKHKFQHLMEIGDEDAVTELFTFGFARNWPGQDRVYENVYNAVQNYLSKFKLLLKMNKEIAKEGKEPMPTEPSEIKTWEEMTKITSNVERYFASKKAREDIRLSGHPKRKDSLVYDDDFVRVLVPLTYAAAVKYGYDEWTWANRASFDEILAGDDNTRFRDAWLAATKKGSFYVYINFKVPVPCWIARTSGSFKACDLTSLAVEFNVADLKNPGDPNDWEVWDEENRNTRKISDIKSMILSEPTRPQDDVEELPIQRGANVYGSAEQAQEVVAHLDMALQAIQEWLVQFDPKSVKSDVMKLD